MIITSVQLVYFSPTGTTRNVLEAIMRGMGNVSVQHCDLTSPSTASGGILPIRADFAILGIPVYAGRVPLTAGARLQRLQARNTPAVVVAVYGNRAYEDALLELRDLAVMRGFRPVAGGAFIGEHSFSDAETPIAEGRPDGEDLRKAEAFGSEIRSRMAAIGSLASPPDLPVPGNTPYREIPAMPATAPALREDLCTLCGMCADLCPTGAIAAGNTVSIRAEDCIRCCACVKGCPVRALIMEDPHVRKITRWLGDTCRERKEPETFFSL